MPRSERAELIRQIRLELIGESQFVPMWAQLRVWRCSCGIDHTAVGDEDFDDWAQRHTGVAEPAELLPRLYGGLYDTLNRCYVEGARPEPGQVYEFSCHPGQIPALLFDEPGVMRVMLLGGPGSGKTRTLSLLSALDGLELPDEEQGQVGATRDRVDVMWDDAADLLVPTGWIKAPKDLSSKGNGRLRQMVLSNNHVFDFKAAKEPSRRVGSPIQGRSWARAKVDETQNVHDRAQADIDERGRRAGMEYRVFESATNFGLGHFEARKERYKDSRYHRIIRLNPLANIFTDPKYWLRFKSFYSGHDWRQRIMAEDVPPEQLVYAPFSFPHTVRPAPDSSWDVTREITRAKWGHLQKNQAGWDWVVGTDFGTLCTVSIWLKAFREPTTGEVLWWALQEHTSGSHTNAGQHARKLMGFAHPSTFLVSADPGINTKDADKSDYELMRREGLTVRPAWHEPIRVLHRVRMMQALLEDAKGKRRFFIDCDHNRAPACPKLVQAFLTQVYDDRGNPENVRKDYSDPTHWPASASYGLFPFERLRGQSTFEVITGADEDPLLVKAAQIAARRGVG